MVEVDIKDIRSAVIAYEKENCRSKRASNYARNCIGEVFKSI